MHPPVALSTTQTDSNSSSNHNLSLNPNHSNNTKIEELSVTNSPTIITTILIIRILPLHTTKIHTLPITAIAIIIRVIVLNLIKLITVSHSIEMKAKATKDSLVPFSAGKKYPCIFNLKHYFLEIDPTVFLNGVTDICVLVTSTKKSKLKKKHYSKLQRALIPLLKMPPVMITSRSKSTTSSIYLFHLFKKTSNPLDFLNACSITSIDAATLSSLLSREMLSHLLVMV